MTSQSFPGLGQKSSVATGAGDPLFCLPRGMNPQCMHQNWKTRYCARGFNLNLDRKSTPFRIYATQLTAQSVCLTKCLFMELCNACRGYLLTIFDRCLESLTNSKAGGATSKGVRQSVCKLARRSRRPRDRLKALVF